MLSMASSSSSSSSSLSRSWLYHVFLSFRGVDVRKGFLSHVRKGLESKGIIAFVDDNMKRGESVLGAIRQSRVAVVLLSHNYASSSWCLDELVEIMKCREEDHQPVLPIFYDVDPTDVRKQTGDFGKAFDETCVGKTEEVKQAWRQALKDVAGIAGYHSSNCDSEADLISKVASDVTAVLGFTPSKDFDDFVGIGARITQIKSKLVLQLEEVKVIMLVGPAGIGKTTTARVLYNQLSPGFPFNTFLENIRGSYEKPCGNDYQLKLSLQKNLLSQLLNQRDIEVRHLGVAQQMLSGKKVLVVLDRKLLKQLRLGIDHIYEMKFPTSDESLEIFCHYAFGQKSPDCGFEMLAWEVTRLAGDLPLGLKVMGSYLRGMSRDEWMDTLPRLRSSLDTEIESTLRFSYDGLSDKDKALFLHIACFFSYYHVDRVKRCLEKSGLEVNHGLQVLADKSLISTESGHVEMHRLLKEMGREIVKKQSLEEPGKRQFLWDTEEISEVLEESTGTGNILGIYFKSGCDHLPISKSAFDRMNNLQFLSLSPGTLCMPEGLNCLPDKLRMLRWKNYTLRFWPSKFSFKFLVELIMPFSSFEKLWEGIQPLPCLKLMDLSYSHHLKEIPDLSKATSLERLDLGHCQSLLEFPNVPESIVKLELSGTRIEEIPTWIDKLFRLRELDMRRCKKLKKISPNISKLENLEHLDLSYCYGLELVALPCSLLSIDAHGCRSLKRIDFSSFQNPNIILNFGDCFNLNQEARKLIQTSACKYAILPGEVPAHFTHRASSSSLTINLTPSPLPLSFAFKACILLSEGNVFKNAYV